MVQLPRLSTDGGDSREHIISEGNGNKCYWQKKFVYNSFLTKNIRVR